MRSDDSIRDAILEEALVAIPFDGWTDHVVSAAAEKIGVGSVVAGRLFKNGAASLVEHYSNQADNTMLEFLESQNLDELGVRQRISIAVKFRLKQNESNREAIRAALSFLLLPRNSLMSARCLYRTVDSIWFGVGDKSTDFNFYTKRSLLAAAYTATLLYWLDDQSYESQDTWAFLNRRLDDIVTFGRASARVKAKLPSPYLLSKIWMNRTKPT